MDGILNINKPAGMTSHDVVIEVRKRFKMRKVGHTGTLDPDATGVLVVCLGKATKMVRFLLNDEKEYESVLILGISTHTQDSSGTIIKKVDNFSITEEEIKEVSKRFEGEQEQIPPMVSAVHHHGRRLYELARQGKVVERKPRKINIFSFKIIEIKIPEVRFNIVCSKGTYIRTICSDLGDALGCGAHQAKLVRIRAGQFHIKDSLTLDELWQASQPETLLWKYHGLGLRS
jgi:tRNA pseudouridine55 synthase